jgi:hypothetical protein
MKFADHKRKHFRDLAFELLEARGPKLIIAVCDGPGYVRGAIRRLHREFRGSGRSLAVSCAKALLGRGLSALGELVRPATVDAICISGFGDLSPTAREKLFSELNFRRDALTSLGVPMLFWLRTPELRRLVEVAPDFWSRRSVVCYFTETSAADLLRKLFHDGSSTAAKSESETPISRALQALVSAETELMGCLTRRESFSLPKADELIRRISTSVESLRRECKNGRQIEVTLWLWNMTHLDYDLQRMLDRLEERQRGLFEYLYTDRNEVVLHLCERIPTYLSSYLRQLEGNIRKKQWVGLVSHIRALATRKLRRMARELVSRVPAGRADFESLLRGEEWRAGPDFSSTNAFAHSAARDLESWLAGTSDSMPAAFSHEEGRVLRLLYSDSISSTALAKVLGIPEREAVDKLRGLKEKVRLFLASTG